MDSVTDKLVKSGTLRYCKCGCGEVIRDHRRIYVNDNHKRNAYRRRRKIREGTLKTKEQIHAMSLVNIHKAKQKFIRMSRERHLRLIRTLYRWIGGDNRDGGKRLWFRFYDVRGSGIYTDEEIKWFMSRGKYTNWANLTNMMIDIGLINRRTQEGKANNVFEYQICENINERYF